MTASNCTEFSSCAHEQWRAIPDFPAYSASDLGRVMRTARGQATQIGKILKPYISPTGYAHLTLYISGKARLVAVQRLVLAAFDGMPPKGYQAAHLNGNRSDNRLVNLAWVTAKENNSHKHLHGTAQIGEKSSNAKLKTAQVIAIRQSKKTMSYREISRSMGLKLSTVKAVCSRRLWDHVP